MTVSRESNDKYQRFHRSAKVQTRVIDPNNFTYYNVIRSLESILYSKNKENILDYGCGVGTFSFFMASKGHTVTGVDISDKAINTAKLSSEAMGLDRNTTFLNLVESKKHLKKDDFDLLTMIEVIEHVPNDKAAMKHLSALIKRGGYILLTTPSLSAPLYKWGLLNKFDQRVGHIRRYSRESIKDLFKDTEMKVISLSEKDSVLRNSLYTFPPAGFLIRFIKGPISSFMSWLENPLIKLFGGSSFYVIAKKV